MFHDCHCQLHEVAYESDKIAPDFHNLTYDRRRFRSPWSQVDAAPVV
jgi:hypothetical protein